MEAEKPGRSRYPLVNIAVYTLFVMGGLIGGLALFSLLSPQVRYGSALVHLAFGVLIFSLGFMARKKPVVNIAIGLGLVMLNFLADLLLDPTLFLNGIHLKIIVLLLLLLGLGQAIKARKDVRSRKENPPSDS